jgi:hypothetical protein
MAGRSHGKFLEKGLVQREDPSRPLPPPKSSGLAWTDIFTPPCSSSCCLDFADSYLAIPAFLSAYVHAYQCLC